MMTPSGLGAAKLKARLSLLGLLALVLTPAWPADRPASIAFVSAREGDAEVYVVNADGSGLKRLTRATGEDTAPAWSPDGTRLAFVSERDGNSEVYVMNADGSGQRNLTRNPAADTHPGWSPDGKRLVFCTDRDGNCELYTCAADGSAPSNVTRHAGWDSDPTWSPTGDRLAFVTDRTGDQDVFVCAPDGTAVSDVGRHEAWDGDPLFSPDGKHLAFRTHRDGNIGLYQCDLADGRLSNLNQNNVWNEQGDWTRDLTRFVWATCPQDLRQIIIADFASHARTPVPGQQGNNWSPHWSPTGTMLCFLSDRSGVTELYVMQPDGTAVRNLSQGEVLDQPPVWRP